MHHGLAGTYEHWRVINATRELHPFHIHQVHFLAFAQNNQPLSNSTWLDAANAPVARSVDVIVNFTDLVIRGLRLAFTAYGIHMFSDGSPRLH